MQNAPHLITVLDASNLFNVAEQTVRRKIQEKKIQSKGILAKAISVPRTPLPGSYFKERFVHLYSFTDLKVELSNAS